MMYAHWKNGTHENGAVFEAYFRSLPFGNGFAVFAGLERMVTWLNRLVFDDDDIAYLREQEEKYDPGFLEELRRFRFRGDLFSVREGTVVFPNEPLVVVRGRIFEVQFMETALLNFMNYQTLVATKAARIKQVAGEDMLLEFGTRRAQEADAAVWGARAAYLAGFHATSNVQAARMFGIPAQGTQSHSWIQSHDDEQTAFLRFADALPDHVVLLVDTYDTLRSGVPNAIEIAKTLKKRGKRLKAIRLDSGDLAYLSKQARKMLDDAGLKEVKIVASGDLDEHTISELKAQGARIDIWGVGTQLITAADQPALGGVYKLAARESDGRWVPVIKISSNPEKVTTPGYKKVERIYDRKTGKAAADYVSLLEEDEVRQGKKIKLFNPVYPFMYKYMQNYEAESLLEPVLVNGKPAGSLPSLEENRTWHREQLHRFWPEYLRKMNPERYPVDYSHKVWRLKMDMIEKYKKSWNRENESP